MIFFHGLKRTAAMRFFMRIGLPGKSSLRFNIYEPGENLKVTLYTLEKGFTMNEELASYLINNPDVEINVGLAG